ncbi:MAG: hypothetical protein KAX19_00820, partial [Candidatus Brocadiae bacterium]|nr:hypothetical protein [Candidatus Brocadiia bacterium]
MRRCIRPPMLLLSSLTIMLGLLHGGVSFDASAQTVNIVRPNGTDWPGPVGEWLAIAVGGPPDGEYSWSAPGSSELTWDSTPYVSYATITYSSPGGYSVSVRYTWQGRTVSDTEGTFVALEADVDMEGLSEQDEMDPGAILCAGGARKRITLSYAPYGGGLAVHKLSLWGNGVQFYTTQTGGTPLTDLVWDDCQNPPPIDGEDDWGEIPAELWVEATSASDALRDKRITLIYTAWAHLGGSSYRPGGHSDVILITAVDVEIHTPATFPAYVCLDGNLSLGCTVTPAAAGGGTYSWSKVTGPGNVTFTPSASAEDPSFSADAAGTYTVKVEYTKGGTTCSDTSGNIVV